MIIMLLLLVLLILVVVSLLHIIIIIIISFINAYPPTAPPEVDFADLNLTFSVGANNSNDTHTHTDVNRLNSRVTRSLLP